MLLCFKIFAIITILINIAALVTLVVGFLYNRKKENVIPEKKAAIGVFMGGAFALYILFLFVTTVLGLVIRNFYSAILILFLILPFVIGHYSKYENIKKCTFLQIISFLCSIAVLVLII